MLQSVRQHIASAQAVKIYFIVTDTMGSGIVSITIYFIFTEEKMTNWYQSKRVVAKRSSLHRSKAEKVEGSTK
ncbi:hypothetical protein ASG93_32270 [Paenibacillus sp. Soil787]|nr:hypothetical protein ASG93_32270 [Paenibacillus sp. Soil787]